MASRAYPVDAVSGAPLFAAKEARRVLAAALPGATSARPLGSLSGIRFGSGDVVTLNTGVSPVTWQVQPHTGVSDCGSATAGPYGYSTDGVAVAGFPTSGNVNAANAANPRIDIVWVRIDDPGDGDGTGAPGPVFGYTPGAAAATPAQPAAPARCMTLATISVPKAGGGSPTVATVAPLLQTQIMPARSAAEMALLPTGDGYYCDRLDLNYLLRHDGTVWVPQVQTFRGSEAVMAGAAPPAGQRLTVYTDTWVGTVANGAGRFDIPLAPAFPNGLVSAQLTPAASANNTFTGCRADIAFSSKSNLSGVAYAPGGGFVASGAAIRVNWVAYGW